MKTEMENENENETEVTLEVAPNMEQLVGASIVEGFAAFATAARLLGNDAKVASCWKGVSIPTALLWVIEEVSEAFTALATFGDSDDSDRTGIQAEIADAFNDATGIIEACFGAFGSQSLNIWRDQYLEAQVSRNREARWWYGPIIRRNGNHAFGAAKAGEFHQDEQLARRMSKPNVRATMARKLFLGKSASREWDTVKQPVVKLNVQSSADYIAASNKVNFYFGVSARKGRTTDEIVAAIIESTFDSVTKSDMKAMLTEDWNGRGHAWTKGNIAPFGKLKTAIKKTIHPLRDEKGFLLLDIRCRTDNVTNAGKARSRAAGNYEILATIETKKENKGDE